MRNRLILIGVAIAVLIASAVLVGAQEFDLWFTNPNLFLPSAPPEKAHRPLAAAEEVSLKFLGSTLWSSMVDVVIVDTLAYCAMYSGLMHTGRQRSYNTEMCLQSLFTRGLCH